MSESKKQKTLKTSFRLKGRGLHLGVETEVEVKPADENTGILFRRSDVEGSVWNRAVYENINSDNALGRHLRFVLRFILWFILWFIRRLFVHICSWI